MAAAGTPSNLGKVGDASKWHVPHFDWMLTIHRALALADADPLGVNQNVTFEEVGGLDDRKTVVLLRDSSVLTSGQISIR